MQPFIYDNTAYRSEQARDLHLNKPSHRAAVLNKKPVLHDVFPANALNSHEIETLAYDEEQETLTIASDAPDRMDAEVIRHPTFGRANDKILFVLMFGSVAAIKIAFIAFIIFFFSAVFTAIIRESLSFKESFSMYFFAGGFYIIIPCIISAIICTPILPYYIKKVAKKARPLHEINRGTGRVKLWCKKTHQLLYDVAFEDCVLETINIFTHQGITDYHQVFLRCNNAPKLKIDVAFFGDNKEGEDVTAIWNFVQRYMDTSRPLPDVPCFEMTRHLDPASAAHDIKTQRNPRYWRDMDFATLYQKRREFKAAVRKLPKFR
ncbi:hypothetical protein [Motilimonas pumila]|uniref:Uncharacterized protein n=1 Tax=Motilimonas pumila TaxID=2303987 RepID=A0A418YBJ1_9GAMM|nr:hypothetical protein [Motilimonas pumila]RJG41843.1 hypothetical protein D1Z90_15835 [Motilimonas pumila]